MALITGAVVATGNGIPEPSMIQRKQELEAAKAQAAVVTDLLKRKKKSDEAKEGEADKSADEKKEDDDA